MRRGRGFSLIELVLVLGILAVMAALAAPRYALALADYRAEHAARRIVADIAATQSAARATASSETITFDLPANAYQIPPAVAGNTPARLTLSDAPFDASLVSASFGAAGGNSLTFNGFGLATSGGTIVVRSGGMSRTVIIDPGTGAATIK
jgi:prepilin-type N-terminal cleavage/methylation domain-containing protein